ncbi:MAG TPA: SRPBCC family protein [Acidimicrobiia bacterium]|nr:SRPBCC family protein [Acidimicrobiia bacterium]
MRRRHIEVTAHSDAAPDAVFALLADGATWPRWSPIESFELEREGDPPPEGPGAIRVFRRGRTVGRDQLVDVAPAERFVYASLSGLPVRDYLAEVELTAVVGGTEIRWQATFSPKMPGTGRLLERGLRRFLEQCARGAAAHAAG